MVTAAVFQYMSLNATEGDKVAKKAVPSFKKLENFPASPTSTWRDLWQIAGRAGVVLWLRMRVQRSAGPAGGSASPLSDNTQG